MLSSILKGYVQFILHNRGMVKMIERLSKKQGIENGVSGFYQHMATTFPQKKSYIGIQYMQKVLSDQESRAMTHILGVTLQHYLKEAYVLNLFQGSKLKKKMRLSLLKKAREISSLLFQAWYSMICIIYLPNKVFIDSLRIRQQRFSCYYIVRYVS